MVKKTNSGLIGDSVPSIGLLDSLIIIFSSTAICLFLFWMAATVVAVPIFTTIPSFIAHAFSTIWSTFFVGTGAFAAAVVRAFDRTTARPNYLLWILGTTILFLGTIVLLERAVLPPSAKLPALTVQVDPDTVSISPGNFAPVTYRFNETNGVTTTIWAEDVDWVLNDGTKLAPTVKEARILGGSITIPAGGRNSFTDNIWMNPAIAALVRQHGQSEVRLVLTFIGSGPGQQKRDTETKGILSIQLPP